MSEKLRSAPVNDWDSCQFFRRSQLGTDSDIAAGEILSYKVMSLLFTIDSLSCYSRESCGHAERLEWFAWFVLGY